MTGQPLITCIIPAWNAERYLGEALESVLAQTCPAGEIIVVDDGSTDGTARVAESFGEPVRCVRQQNAGAPAARNRGVREARGELIAFTDADDLWHPEKLARQIARFEQRADLDVSLTHYQNFWIPELAAEAERMPHRNRSLPGVLATTGVVRRITLDSVGLLRETLRHRDNAEWIARAASRGAIIEMLTDVLARRRIHHSNMSRKRGQAEVSELFEIVRARLGRDKRGERDA